ncbi:MAG: type 1 glutamine amidotransferase domain-containing protein [Actinomycetota bacterium]
MEQKLSGKRVAFLATDGVEQVELTEPWQVTKDAGATVDLVSLKPGEIQGMEHMDKGERFSVDRTVEEVRAEEYDALVIPGGVANPDRMRTDPRAVGFVRAFFQSSKPVAVICHGPWMLVEADVLRGRTVTSWPSLQTDIRNAGGQWVDEDVHVDHGLVTSRKPDDLPAFCAKLVEEFAEGVHQPQPEETRQAS